MQGEKHKVCIACSLVFTGLVLSVSGSAGAALARDDYPTAIFGFILAGVLVFLPVRAALKGARDAG